MQSRGSPYGQLAFSFDVSSIAFNFYGLLTGAFTAQALDSSLNIVDSFFDSDTSLDNPGGPITLSGSGIRYLRFGDFPNGGEESGIDNVVIETPATTVPEPATLLLFGGALSLAGLRRYRQSRKR